MDSKNNNSVLNQLIDLYTQKIYSGLPEWNYAGADKNTEVQRQKDTFVAKVNELKALLQKHGVQDEKIALRAMDLVIAKHVPDEHIQIRIAGEDKRAADLSNYPELKYKIPPNEKHNLIVSDEQFNKSELFTLTAPSDPDQIANILVAEKQIGNNAVGIVAIDSFVIEYANEKVYEQVDKIADYVLENSAHWNDIVFDFRGNGGGDASIIKQIGERLSGKKLEYADKIEIINPKLMEQTGAPERYEQKLNDKTFSGNIYVLQDGGNSSAADGAIWMLRQMDNCTTVGENTYGAFAGGDVKKHQMEGGTLFMGNTYRERTMPDGRKVEEGKGIPPDIICKSKDAYQRVINLITEKSKTKQISGEQQRIDELKSNIRRVNGVVSNGDEKVKFKQSDIKQNKVLVKVSQMM